MKVLEVIKDAVTEINEHGINYFNEDVVGFECRKNVIVTNQIRIGDDPIAMFRPQELCILELQHKGKSWQVGYGTDEGLNADWYVIKPGRAKFISPEKFVKVFDYEEEEE